MKLSEAEVTQQVVDWFRAHGWIAYRKNVGVLRDGNHVTRFGKPGECDWLFARPFSHPCGPCVCEVEMKATGKKPAPQQAEYIALRNYFGIPAVAVDSLEALKAWYYERGLDKEWRMTA